MDCGKTGKIIFELRREKGMTQKQLADAINISDKTVSKWERGLGCPDVSLLGELSEVLEVNVEKLLGGCLDKNDTDGGNMKKLKFYVCPECGNIMTSTGKSEISCCGRKLSELTAVKADENHSVKIEAMDDESYVVFDHEMTKQHFISFVAYSTCDRLTMVRLYPEQNAEVRFPRLRGGRLYFYCNEHGLFYV